MSQVALFDAAIDDLNRSGLSPADIDAREAGNLELSTVGIPTGSSGYVIPYYDLYGKPRPFYRVKLFGHAVKYKQPKNTSNHVYFPKNLQKVLQGKDYILICEGEKKAAASVRADVPCCALGGVDSWKNRTLFIPEGSDLAKAYGQKDQISVKLPAGQEDVTEMGLTILANGMQELIDHIIANKLHVLIAFDSDQDMGLKYEVQRAAAALAFELRYRGIEFERIHQLLLPPLKTVEQVKTGLDDFLVAKGAEALKELVKDTLERRATFPRHPNVFEFVNRKLQRGKMTRKEAQNVSISILSDLDASGARLRSMDGNMMYYFDYSSRRLIKAAFNLGSNKNVIHETDFGRLLYKKYGLSAADSRILTWLDAQFNAENPIENVYPHRVIAKPELKEDCVRYQLSDSQYVQVSADTVADVQDNGTSGYLFEAGQVESIEGAELLECVENLRATHATPGKPIKPWWMDVLKDVRLRHHPEDYNRTIACLLFYMSPWLYKWRGMQLPVELAIGEGGSGKSSLYEHRLNTITGRPELRNAPLDIKDWHASITNTGGLHVTDNVQLLDKQLRQRLSDDICRLVTEPNPHVEKRKLYSDNELMRLPVFAVFAITAIQQPFMQADLLQRAILIELDKSGNYDSDRGGSIQYDSAWVPNQMQRFGGRANWVAHHLYVLHRFFQIVRRRWNPRYSASYRLINFEQAIMCMAEVFGIESSWIPNYLAKTSAQTISEADWTLEGLITFTSNMEPKLKGRKFTATDISNWALGREDYMDCAQLTNARRLGRYIKSHQYTVEQSARIFETGMINNRVGYEIR